MVKAMDMADYIIVKANSLGKPVSNLQLQKIMYFLNAIYLVKNGPDKPLITDTKFRRWTYGPTQTSVYYEYCQNKDKRIVRPISHIYIYLNSNKPTIEEFDMNSFEISNNVQTNYIKNNILTFLNMSTASLVTESHNEPQWKKLEYNEEYDNVATYEYYHKLNNQFWRK